MRKRSIRRWARQRGGGRCESPARAVRRWLSRSAPEPAVGGGGISRYRSRASPFGEIQVVPRLNNRPESVGLRAFFVR